MKKFIFTLVTVATLVGCTRIETGEVGLRVNFDKTIAERELQPGSFNQVLVGEVLKFPVRDVRVNIDNQKPQTADNSTLADFDISIVYSVTPSSVSELWATKSRGWHEYTKDGHVLLMSNFVETIARNAAYKSVRNFDALKVADNRVAIEAEVIKIVNEHLLHEKLNNSIVVSQVLIRNIQPADAIVASANEVVKASNELRVKTIEVDTAKKEAERIAALNSNSKAIEYMNAQAQMKIAEGVAAGKVHTIVVPMDFKGMVNVGK